MNEFETDLESSTVIHRPTGIVWEFQQELDGAWRGSSTTVPSPGSREAFLTLTVRAGEAFSQAVSAVGFPDIDPSS